MSGLSDAERESLVAAFVRSTRNPEHLAFLAEPAVEQIIATRVTAALNEAAKEIEVAASEWRDDWIWETAEAMESAAQIVRAAIPKPPDVVRQP